MAAIWQRTPISRLSINEIHLLHDGQRPLYNPNINDHIGARLPHAIALPENWQPATPATKPAASSTSTITHHNERSAELEQLHHFADRTRQNVDELFSGLAEKGFAHPPFECRRWQHQPKHSLRIGGWPDHAKHVSEFR